MAEWKLFPDGTVPEYTTPGWYAGRARAPHLEQPGHRERLFMTRDHLLELTSTRFDGQHDSTVTDLGCGDGGLLSILPPRLHGHGYDISPEAVRGAQESRHVDSRLLDVVTEEPDWADIVVCTEMLEHLVDPHAFVRRVARHARFLVASSPVTETDQVHYEFHTWAWDADGYEALLTQAGYEVVRWDRVQSFQVITGRRV